MLYKYKHFLITIPIYQKIMALNDIRSLHSLNGNEWQTLDSLAKRLCACH